MVNWIYYSKFCILKSFIDCVLGEDHSNIGLILLSYMYKKSIFYIFLKVVKRQIMHRITKQYIIYGSFCILINTKKKKIMNVEEL